MAPGEPETLSPRDRRLVRLCAGITRGAWEEVRQVRREAPEGEPDRAWREAVLQTHLFCGFPRVVEALAVLEDEGGLGAPEPPEVLDDEERLRRGRALFGRIYADRAGELERALERRLPEFASWILGHAYGRVLGRPGLDPGTRELLAVVCLAVQRNQDRQLAGHLRGALRCGASPAALRATFELVQPLLESGRHRQLLRWLESASA